MGSTRGHHTSRGQNTASGGGQNGNGNATGSNGRRQSSITTLTTSCRSKNTNRSFTSSNLDVPGKGSGKSRKERSLSLKRNLHSAFKLFVTSALYTVCLLGFYGGQRSKSSVNFFGESTPATIVISAICKFFPTKIFLFTLNTTK